MRSSGLWGVTSYFNPAGYARRHQNYRLFRERLVIPLVAVELSFDGRFELDDGDADVLVQITGGDVLWQKERLLNIGLAHVPESCPRIAWLDCDILFGDDAWVERAHAALDAHALVHLFTERHDLGPDPDITKLGSWSASPTSESLIYKVGRHEATAEDFQQSDAPLLRRTTVGLAWASHRAILAPHGLYDAAILGSGDRAMACAAFGRLEDGARALMMNARRVEHYEAWARPFFASVRGRVGHIDGRLFHLWHGALADRQYGSRHQQLEPFAFDPHTDIATDECGAWRWNSDKPPLHAFARDYFASRQEDGASGPR